MSLLPVSVGVVPSGVSLVIIEKRSRDKVTVLDIEGAIKLGESAEFFSNALDTVLRKEKTNVVINFSGINYIDSTGMGELIGYLSKFSGQNRQVLLVNPSGRILKLLKVVRLDKVFKIFPDEDSAVEYAKEHVET
jgi:anti-anti-sigma factor